MILDGYWKKELSNDAKLLRRTQKPLLKSLKDVDHQVNKAVLYSAIVMRKIIYDEEEGRKVISEIIRKNHEKNSYPPEPEYWQEWGKPINHDPENLKKPLELPPFKILHYKIPVIRYPFWSVSSVSELLQSSDMIKRSSMEALFNKANIEPLCENSEEFVQLATMWVHERFEPDCYNGFDREEKTLPLKNAISQIVHAYSWDVVHKDNCPYGFVVASDKQRYKEAYFFLISDWIDAIEFCAKESNIY